MIQRLQGGWRAAGGEPLLWQELPELTRVFRGDHGFALSTTTNGTTIDTDTTSGFKV